MLIKILICTRCISFVASDTSFFDYQGASSSNDSPQKLIEKQKRLLSQLRWKHEEYLHYFSGLECTIKIVFFPICFEYYSEQNKNASAACQDEVRVTMGTLVCVDIIICLF